MNPLSLLSPKGELNSLREEAFGMTGKFSVLQKSVPKMGGFPHDPTRENGVQKRPQAFLNPEIKIFFPLIMPKATRQAFPIILSVRPAAPAR